MEFPQEGTVVLYNTTRYEVETGAKKEIKGQGKVLGYCDAGNSLILLDLSGNHPTKSYLYKTFLCPIKDLKVK